VPKNIINDAINSFFIETAISILVISNHNSFRVLYAKIASVYFIRKTYLYFSIGNGQPSTVPNVSAHFRSLLPMKQINETSRRVPKLKAQFVKIFTDIFLPR